MTPAWPCVCPPRGRSPAVACRSTVRAKGLSGGAGRRPLHVLGSGIATRIPSGRRQRVTGYSTELFGDEPLTKLYIQDYTYPEWCDSPHSARGRPGRIHQHSPGRSIVKDTAAALTRGLTARHIRFIALGSAIGTGLFYGSAEA